jgi:hypothetical protein
MATIEKWSRIPPGIRAHLIERMHDRGVKIEDLNRLRLWIESSPEVPPGPWYKDFGSFKLCGEGIYPKTFLSPGQVARGKKL